MKQKQRVVFFGMVAVALIFAACDGDRGNNSSKTEGDSSSSVEISSSSEQINTSSVVKSSSSSVGGSSSSLMVSSSSVTLLSSFSTPLSSSVGESSSSSSIEYGFLTYGGQTYRTVTIGTQTWMAENLNYAVDGSLCYDNTENNCNLYGRLYTWAVVMGVASTYNSANLGDSVNHQGICPSGWHVPRSSEWATLENAVGGSSTAGTYLKSTSGWYNDGNGTDAYGFSALPGGNDHGSAFNLVGNYGSWWTATEYSPTSAYYRIMYSNGTYVYTDYYPKAYGRSLRCLKD